MKHKLETCAWNILLMEEILRHLGFLKYCESQDLRRLRLCRISAITTSAGTLGLVRVCGSVVQAIDGFGFPWHSVEGVRGDLQDFVQHYVKFLGAC